MNSSCRAWGLGLVSPNLGITTESWLTSTTEHFGCLTDKAQERFSYHGCASLDDVVVVAGYATVGNDVDSVGEGSGEARSDREEGRSSFDLLRSHLGNSWRSFVLVLGHECCDEVRQGSPWIKAFPSSEAEGIIMKKRYLFAAHADRGRMFATMHFSSGPG